MDCPGCEEQLASVAEIMLFCKADKVRSFFLIVYTNFSRTCT